METEYCDLMQETDENAVKVLHRLMSNLDEKDPAMIEATARLYYAVMMMTVIPKNHQTLW